jgi:TetR/AcrR family transcriptional regulator, copper-responsive repressor
MVQKKSNGPSSASPRSRGRPRAYQPELALAQARDAFWRDGFAATSLDDLSAATGMNRPSLYAAFGDKQALYIKAYASYRAEVRESFRPLFLAEEPLRDKLRRILVAALDLYSSGEPGPRGCFTVLTASSDVVADPKIRAIVVEALTSVDEGFARLFAAAVETGELPGDADPTRLARMAAATTHSLSVRARAGVARRDLETLIEDAVVTILGPRAAPPRSALRDNIHD